MKNNQSVIPVKETHKIGLLPRLNYAVKSWVNQWSGDGILSPGLGYTTQTTLQWLIGSHSFNRRGLQQLVDTGYTLNPVGYSVVNKILNAQRNIKFVPYRNGKVYKAGEYTLDTNYALRMLCHSRPSSERCHSFAASIPFLWKSLSHSLFSALFFP